MGAGVRVRGWLGLGEWLLGKERAYLIKNPNMKIIFGLLPSLWWIQAKNKAKMPIFRVIYHKKPQKRLKLTRNGLKLCYLSSL